MRETIDETNRRRRKQIEYNKNNNITPVSIKKNIDDIMASTTVAENFQKVRKKVKKDKDDFLEYLSLDSKEKVVDLLKKEMRKAADSLDFEKAAEIRDRIFELEGL
jgi:excinuclease ABC subunit B